MQGKGLITIVAIVLGLICLNELLPTWYASKIESQIEAAKGNEKEIKRIKEDTLNLGYTKLYYSKAKDKEMKLGLDLKGGINVLLEINQRDLVNDLTNYSTNPVHKEIFINGIKDKKVTAEIISVEGRKVLEAGLVTPGKGIDISGIPAGVYFINVKSGDTKSYSQKLIIK